jgi:Tfp pilus assembly protein PilV
MSVFRKRKCFRRKRTQQGSSFLELLIAVSIFVVIMVATVDIFAKMASAKAEFDRVRASHEKAQIAIETLGKSIRSGVVISPITQGENPSIRIYDYSQGVCMLYAFDNSTHTLSRSMRVLDRNQCTGFTIFLPSSTDTLVSEGIQGQFFVIPSKEATDTTGLVQVRARLFDPNDPSDFHQTRIQTTVSLRNSE